MSGRCYLFAGGGTGGHLIPGIAIAEELLAMEPDARILFVGSDRAIEREIMASTAFEHRVLPSVSLAGAMRHPWRFLRGALAARRAAVQLLGTVRPDVVIGCGGFASAAPVWAAARRPVPCVLLEQNVIPGRTTRWLSRLGGTVCLTFAETQQHLPACAATVVTGNPVRRALCAPGRPAEGNRLLVLGGSQGARSVNHRLIEFVAAQGESLAGWSVVHQTGSADEDSVRAAYAASGVEAEVAAYFTDMSTRYRQAGLVVSRAGGTTLAELACAGLPALLLPYPHAPGNHQWHNARVFEQAGAAVLCREDRSDAAAGEEFALALRGLLSDASRRVSMAQAMQRLGRPEAAAAVVAVVRGLAGN